MYYMHDMNESGYILKAVVIWCDWLGESEGQLWI